MEIKRKADVLLQNLNHQINSFEIKRTDNKRKSFWFKVLIIGLGAVNTAILGFKISDANSDITRNIAIVISAVVSILSALEGYFNHQAVWIRYNITLSQLKSLKAELEYLTTPGQQLIKEENIDHLFVRYQSVLSETNEMWLNIRKNEGASLKLPKQN